jgi:hypothetical protein
VERVQLETFHLLAHLFHDLYTYRLCLFLVLSFLS